MHRETICVHTITAGVSKNVFFFTDRVSHFRASKKIFRVIHLSRKRRRNVYIFLHLRKTEPDSVQKDYELLNQETPDHQTPTTFTVTGKTQQSPFL